MPGTTLKTISLVLSYLKRMQLLAFALTFNFPEHARAGVFCSQLFSKKVFVLSLCLLSCLLSKPESEGHW
jgi:hypothetical protein